MKFLIDNNLSFKLVQPLQNYFPESSHIRNELSIDADDLSIWNFARDNGFIILTKDNDFDERSQLEGCPPKIVHLVCGNQITFYSKIYLLVENNSFYISLEDIKSNP